MSLGNLPTRGWFLHYCLRITISRSWSVNRHGKKHKECAKSIGILQPLYFTRMPRCKLNPFAGIYMISYHVPLSRIEYFLRPTIGQTNLYPELRRACLHDKVGKDCGCRFSSLHGAEYNITQLSTFCISG